jgi:hypothetical protein
MLTMYYNLFVDIFTNILKHIHARINTDMQYNRIHTRSDNETY